MVQFGGWDMPVQYSGIIDEHRRVRSAVGLFDVSHMGEFEVEGPGALAALQTLTTNDVSRARGRAKSSTRCSAIRRWRGGRPHRLSTGPRPLHDHRQRLNIDKDWPR
jgi:hypothetical protein